MFLFKMKEADRKEILEDRKNIPGSLVTILLVLQQYARATGIEDAFHFFQGLPLFKTILL